MNQFFYSELKVKCREIALDLTSNGKSEDVIKAYVRIIDLSDVARNEGLLALEETPGTCHPACPDLWSADPYED